VGFIAPSTRARPYARSYIRRSRCAGFHPVGRVRKLSDDP
jgi:hypothetical protein